MTICIALWLMIVFLLGLLAGYGIKCEERVQMRLANEGLRNQVHSLRRRIKAYEDAGMMPPKERAE